MTIQEAIRKATERLERPGVANARLDAEVLLSRIVRKDRSWLFSHDQDQIESDTLTLFEQAIERRVRREPLQYILGTQEFWGIDFLVTPDVLIPRPETELVVESTIRCLRQKETPLVIDLCTGSGCIAVSVAKEIGNAQIIATDKSERALSVACKNAEANGVDERITFLEGDLFEPLQKLDILGRVDAIATNPPYIPAGDLPALQAEVRDYEPEMALTSGPEGTEIHRRILAEAPRFLKTGGALIMEMGIGQAAVLNEIAASSGAFTKPVILNDLAGIERVIVVLKT